MDPVATKDQLGAALVKALRAVRRVGDNRERRTELYRAIATASVDLRAHFVVEETGQPDWAGRTWEYREYIRDRYAEAGLSRDEARSVQTSVRYHIGSLVRERLDADQLEDLGLRPEDMAERMREYRKAQSAQLATLKAEPGDLDLGKALAGAFTVLQKISPGQIAELRGAAREQARAVLGRLLRHAEELHAASAPEVKK
ncbi:hypothetical protein [Micromonospora sp. NPDC047730]|uniref:hypothetical protein n=1 Tax=Micromonospora sp. NPDC047730 TaxID=3364253 RepID=UPI0037214502